MKMGSALPRDQPVQTRRPQTLCSELQTYMCQDPLHSAHFPSLSAPVNEDRASGWKRSL